MKLKSYLRGLGLGMVVTTIILVIAFQARNKELSDEEIIARAQELGMVETSLYGAGDENNGKTQPQDAASAGEESGEGKTDPESSSGSDDTEPEITETMPQETTGQQETTKTPETTKNPETTQQQETTKTQETTARPAETSKPEETEKETTSAARETIKIVFENINTADKASRLLFEAGVIQDVDSFNKYLSEQGLAAKVGEGEFEFTKGMTFEEIANIITRRK